MTESKKYNYRLVQDDTGWAVDIIRRVSSKKTIVSKTQGGFETEAEAQDWGQKQVKEFLKRLNLSEQNKRRAKQGEQK